MRSKIVRAVLVPGPAPEVIMQSEIKLERKAEKTKPEKSQVKKELIKVKSEMQVKKLTKAKAEAHVKKEPVKAVKLKGEDDKNKKKMKVMSVRLARDRRLLKKAVQIPRAKFAKLVSAITMDLEPHKCKLNGEALDALQQAAEGRLVEIFEAANKVRRRVNIKRPTLLLRDYQIAMGMA